MQQKISEEEIEFLEAFYDPTAMMECLIPKNIRASHLWGQEDCEGIDVRPYQQAMLNYSYLCADDDRLNEKQNFRRRKCSGDSTNIGARNIGKSFIEICDQFFTLLHYDGDESCVASFDFAHLKKIGQPIVDLTKYHPFFNIMKKPKVDCARFTGGGFEIDTVNGHICYGKNEKVESSEPGTAFHGLHYKTFRYEEFSYASQEGAEKRVDSGNSIGYINRVSGIPDLRLGSPLGDILYDNDLKPWVCRLPQYVREDWDEKEKTKRAKEYNGIESLSYKLNVEAELVEGAFGYFSMERLKENCYYPKKAIKFFEVSKKTYHNFKKNIIIDRIPCEQIIVASDIGTTGTPSEICIFFGNADMFKWRYNIALQKLTTQEQAKVFHWIYKKLGGCIISLDCTNADGRAIADELEILKVSKKHIVRCGFGSNMIIGFETEEDPDDSTKEIVLTDNKGEPIYKLENTLDWANMELEHVFYNGLVEIPHNDKFLKQLQGYFCVKTGNRSKYGSNTEDHLLQSFQCFAIARFQNYNLIFKEEDEEQSTFLGGF